MIVIKDRILEARGCLERHALDALLVTSISTIRYLSGFSGSDGILILTPDAGYFLTDSRYTTQARTEVVHFSVGEYRNKLETVVLRITEMSCKRLGFEASQLSVAVHTELAGKLSAVELVPLGNDLDEIRSVKDAGELAIMEASAAIASDALLDILPLIRPGAIERELALELEIAMKRRGADEKSFDFIVASGERGALPHGRAGGRAVKSGEFITFDFGAMYRGYNSDETVTLAVGKPSSQLSEIYGIVKEAQKLAIAAVRPGIALRELDRIARSFIDDNGYGSYFGHGLGHGIGLEVHEKPIVSSRSEIMAEEGMVFTVEPGVYVPGLGGVRIEDTVVVEEFGCRLITKVSKELRML